MKKIILIMALLLIAAPAMATVTITCAPAAWNTPDYGRGVVTVSYVATANDVRGFAFDVNAFDSAVGSRKFATDVAVIPSVTRLDPNYFIHPRTTRLKDPGATIRTAGVIACTKPTYNESGVLKFPDTLWGINTDGVTTEQASLYEGGNGTALSPGGAGAGSSGDLFKLTVDANCTIEIRENSIRGGVVMEDPDESPALVNAGGILTTTPVALICWGDIGGDFGIKGANDKVNLGDLFTVVNAMNAAYPTGDPGFIYPIGMPSGFEGMDVAADNFGGVPGQNGVINIGDLFMIVNAMNAAYPTGDNTFAYNIGCQ